MYNMITLTGRFTADPKKGTSSTNKHYCTFALANQRTKEKTLFFNCIAYEKTAEFIAEYFKKGDAITVCGPLDYYDNEKDGKKYRNYQIIVTAADFPASSRQKNDNEDPKTADKSEW